MKVHTYQHIVDLSGVHSTESDDVEEVFNTAAVHNTPQPVQFLGRSPSFHHSSGYV